MSTSKVLKSLFSLEAFFSFKMDSYSLYEYLHNEVADWPGFSSDRDEHVSILENMGYQVGIALCERLCKDRPRFKEELDIVKFICQEFWI